MSAGRESPPREPRLPREPALRELPPWRVRGGRVIRGQGVPLLMAVVNVTPDSFSDGGLHADTAGAVRHALECVREGACIIDVGGESTRPGSSPVGEEEQIRRTVPVIAALAAGPILSIDTTRAAVARAALQAGAHVVNDVSAGTDDPAIFERAAEYGAGLVLMHRVRPPHADRYSHEYETPPPFHDVAREVRDWLLERADLAQRAGVARECIALDPGLGFGKNVPQNFALVEQLEVLAATGYPVVVGASRKSFVGAAAGISEPAQRDEASVAVALQAAANGAAVLRVHAVGLHHEALQAWQARRGKD